MPPHETLPTHVGAYYRFTQHGIRRLHTFTFLGGRVEQMTPELEADSPDATLKLTSVQPLPADLAPIVTRTHRLSGLHTIGTIQCDVQGTLATTVGIGPKSHLDPAGTWRRANGDPNAQHRPAPGFGTLLEIMAIEHLKTLGVTHVQTGPSPHISRQKVLRLGGLTIRTPIPIDEWLAGLRRAHAEIQRIVAQRQAATSAP
ncbi:Uncharacterised protein [uncultured archaeon]|nr:Uncharacterised protein [uncultured archaeon]